MSEKEFGIKFTMTDNGFKVEVNGNEALRNAHNDMKDAWKEFMNKASQATQEHHHHHKHSHSHCNCHNNQEHHDSCVDENKKEDLDITTE